MNIDPRKIRIWSKNPRYTNFEEVSFKDIGKEDFEINALDEVFDHYHNNLMKNYSNLIKNRDEIKSMIELLESLLDGYNPNIDEIIVASSPYLNKNKIFDNNQVFYYALEGNRRIFAINILLNTKIKLENKEVETRSIIDGVVEKKYPVFWEKLKDIYSRFDEDIVNAKFLEQIEVKLINIEITKDNEIWKTLNARHFGKRKGKRNWPRGLVLSAINSKVMSIRNSLGKGEGEELTDSDLKKTIKKIEDFTGKEISNRDLQMALWTTYCSNVYNSQPNLSKSDSLSYVNTEEEGSEKNDEDENTLDSQEKSIFKISSLELSMATIKLISNEGIRETLSKIIGLEIDVKRWTVNSKKLPKLVFDSLVIYIVNLIKNKKLNTRYFDQDYENEIKSILSLEEKDKNQLDQIIKKDNNKIDPKNVPLSLLVKNNYQDKIDFNNFTEHEKQEFLNKAKSIVDNIIPILNKILILEAMFSKVKNNINNKFQYALTSLWLIELNSIVKNKEITSIFNFPLVLFASSLRSTSEILMLMLIEENIDNSIFQNSSIQTKNLTKKQNQCFLKISQYPNKFEDWIKTTNLVNLQTKPYIKNVYGAFFIDEKNDNSGSFLCSENKMREFLNGLNQKKASPWKEEKTIKLANELVNFIRWCSFDFEKDKGGSDILNSLIHTPSLLRDIHDDQKKFSALTKEFDLRINLIIQFIEFILS